VSSSEETVVQAIVREGSPGGSETAEGRNCENLSRKWNRGSYGWAEWWIKRGRSDGWKQWLPMLFRGPHKHPKTAHLCTI